MAKRYGSEGSGGFVNGILDQVRMSVGREVELQGSVFASNRPRRLGPGVASRMVKDYYYTSDYGEVPWQRGWHSGLNRTAGERGQDDRNGWRLHGSSFSRVSGRLCHR